jgi:hypothetical protein
MDKPKAQNIMFCAFFIFAAYLVHINKVIFLQQMGDAAIKL